ncbi:MAG: glycoside hydrolase family 88 protein [Bacteroidetes bacterium]|nr:glycoside hydrolase family 88 protein [Bacteroidota bacterium]
MKRKFIKSISVAVIIVSSIISNAQNLDQSYLKSLEQQLIKKDNLFSGRYAEYTVDGKWQFRDNVNWLSGFIGGEFWLTYEMTGREELKKRAVAWANKLIEYAGIDYTHDMGFIFLPTVVKAFSETGDEKYKSAAINAAQMLAKRFNKNGKFIRAWGKLGKPDREGLMIIDTMMNLELLFWAANETGLIELYDIAYKHAVVCMNEHVRSDFSAYHVVEFNPETGKVTKKFTHQGAEDESAWARGQAWGIYGFANAYKYTDDQRFYITAKKMGEYFLNNLPEDGMPYWDLNLTGTENIKDASAAAIAASGFYLLAEITNSRSDYERFTNAADDLTLKLVKGYSFTNSARKEEGLLLHTVYNYNKGWGIGESFPCGDYYFIEALNKYYKRTKEVIQTDLTVPRRQFLLNDDWFYLEDNIADYSKLHLTDKQWQKVNLPHTWNNFDAVDNVPGYRRDASWYEKIISLNTVEKSKQYILYFEGVNISSEVYVNNKFAGKHIGGYIGFEIDLTEFIAEGKNKITVKADNTIDREIIPSQKSDFFIFGGITRDVWLKIFPDNHISLVKISTPNVSPESAETSVNIEFNKELINAVEIQTVVKDPRSKIVLTSSQIIEAVKIANINLPQILEPELWHVNSPNLYAMEISVLSDGKVIDRVNEKYGYRWFEFKEHGPFYLNGERLLLRGTHRHEEHAGLGNALPNSLHRKDMEMIKEMGANFVRLAHYPQDPEVYKACDELGLMVWDELPWCRGGVGNNVWQESAKTMFRGIINQNYNHPSIIMWSIGNEVYWLPDFEGGDDIDLLRSFSEELNKIAHSLDPYRVTSIRKFYEGSDIFDVFSPSIWAGWYSGVYKSYEKAISKAIKEYKRFFHAEYGGSSHVGRHTETTITGDGFLNPDEWAETINQVELKSIAKMGDWSESYIVDLFDWHLMVSERLPDFTGNAQWAFKDFGTPLRPENAIPYMNQKGLVDRDGKPKDAYYVFKSYWTEKPYFCYIESHTWLDRGGQKGLKREVNVFSNCDEVELLVNTKSLGKKKKDISKFPASGATWDVEFLEGVNAIRAVGYRDGKIATEDNLEINYTYKKNDKPEELILSSERLSNGNYLITAKAVDKDKNFCIDYNDRVYFSLSGAGKLLENYGTPGRSSIIEMANGKASIEYKAVPFEEGIIEVRNQDFKGSYISIIN